MALIREIREGLCSKVAAFDPNRIMVTASVCEKGDSKMRETLPRILRQAEGFGLRCDVLMGINCGMQLPHTEREIEKLGAELQSGFTAENAVDDTGHHRVFEDIFSPRQLLIDDVRNDAHRVFCLRQYPHPNARGKNRMLKVVNDFAMESILSGRWTHVPAHTLEIDDDSRFYDGLSTDVNGLKMLFGEMEKSAVSAIGARWRTVCYSEEDFDDGPVSGPDFTIPVDDSYKYLDTSQTEWMRFMPGGGTLGKTDILTACRWPIGHRYPASRSDDVQRTIYVAHSGEPWKIADYSFVLNESRNSDEQLLRWLRGTFGLRRIIGTQYFRPLFVRSSLPLSMEDVPERLYSLMSHACFTADSSLQNGRVDW
ncbi:hypothetical protein FJZ28_05130 [Candidatus Peregrinibacteria bacterium]|nr:hypothetical protein [Candidatus Peregrinibacteria bacterium]